MIAHEERELAFGWEMDEHANMAKSSKLVSSRERRLLPSALQLFRRSLLRALGRACCLGLHTETYNMGDESRDYGHV